MGASPIERSEDQSDADLVIAARSHRAGDNQAFGELVRRYQRMVYAVALALVRYDEADDVAQDAFLRAFRNLDLLADPAKFGVWLRRITFGVAIDHVRAERARRDRTIRLSSSPDADHDGTFDHPSPEPSALDRIGQQETAGRVLAALDRMPARYRVPLTLYHLDGLSHGKVAQSLGVPESTVRSLVARARRKLATLLDYDGAGADMTDVLDDRAREHPRMLHILNGDSVRMTLEQSSVPGAFLPYADVLHEGPVPQATEPWTWRETRSRFLASNGYVSFAEALATYERWDAGLEAFADYDEVVLWFEHDVFDQLLLIRHLDWFSRRDLGRTSLSLICIGEYPGFEPFHGLGQLGPEQLASLLGTRAQVTAEQFALGRRAWAAFTGDDPAVLDALAREDTSRTLPFLAGALERVMEEYPALGTGLPRTERQILELLSREPMALPRLFRAAAEREERVFMGDTTFWQRLRQLAEGHAPLVSLDVPSWEPDGVRAGRAAITPAGRDVLAGRVDAVRLRGFDKWIGGVHLVAPSGGDVAFRR